MNWWLHCSSFQGGAIDLWKRKPKKIKREVSFREDREWQGNKEREREINGMRRDKREWLRELKKRGKKKKKAKRRTMNLESLL